MILTLEVKIETELAEAGELAIAVKDAITQVQVLEMPNGDALYLGDGDVSVVVKDVSA